MLVLIAYVLIYGQQKDWLEDSGIVYSIIAILLLFLTSVLRQRSLKRPTVDLGVFKYRNFSIGIVFLVILYLIRGAFGLTSTYFITVLGMDSLHANELMIYNILGIITGSFIAIRFLIPAKDAAGLVDCRLRFIDGVFWNDVFSFRHRGRCGNIYYPIISSRPGSGNGDVADCDVYCFCCSGTNGAICGFSRGFCSLLYFQSELVADPIIVSCISKEDIAMIWGRDCLYLTSDWQSGYRFTSLPCQDMAC
jgi:hypothetical protein